jgi:heme/copper-type cytochrome/quinol oxidase subunit 2
MLFFVMSTKVHKHDHIQMLGMGVLAVVLVVVVVVVVFVWRGCEAVAIARKAEKGKLYSHDQGTKMEQMQCS